jgi:DNA-binding HxlR family transcriptional regulator
VCLSTSEVTVSDGDDVCLIRGDQGRAVRALLDRIADKWALLIIATLHGGRLRFSELQQRIPDISQRMLTLTLRKLERDGLVSRHVRPTTPPQVEYALTKLGRSLGQPINALTKWAGDNQEAIEAARKQYDKSAKHDVRASG